MTITLESMPSEQALVLDCEGEKLVAILHHPQGMMESAELGLIIVVGGPQYRVGSHRQFVLLARSLAAVGYPALRFDMRGMGDSSGAPVTFEQSSADIESAINALAERMPRLRRIVLWGLCDGASAALLYLDERRDARVKGLCLANPWVRSPDSHSRTTLRHYYTQRVLQPQFWWKLLRGKVALGAVKELESHVRGARAAPAQAADMPFHERMLRGLQAFDGQVLLLMSGQDYTAREFDDRTRTDPRWRGALGRRSTVRSDLADADHTFSSPAAQRAAEELTVRWLGSCAAGR